MNKMKAQMDERILVCVYNGPNGERLIRRGHALAEMLECPLYIMTVDPLPYAEFSVDKAGYVDAWRELADELGATKFILKDDEARPTVKAIKEVAHHYNITQVIVGEAPQNRWEEITKGSFVNVLLNELVFTDIHIVAVDRAIKHSGDAMYEKGIRAFLQKDGAGYQLCFTKSKDNQYEGVFYKEIGTDFNNGMFKFAYGGKAYQVHVMEGRVTEQITEPPNLI